MQGFEIHTNGINVILPHKPYQLQEDYIAKVIQCLQQGTNGVLESPTGTGKTLSLLCASLAWLQESKTLQQASKKLNASDAKFIFHIKDALQETGGNVWDDHSAMKAKTQQGIFSFPKVIYSSRTHLQLSQAIQELKTTSYKHMKSVVLGSRDQLCVHPEVSALMSSTAKVAACRAKIDARLCSFHLHVEEKVNYMSNPVLDIEDLVTLGKKHTCCPYYASRILKNDADIIFTPYNYLVDVKIRKTHNIELAGNVIIFDEAHNIESVCEDGMSFTLHSRDLAHCINEVLYLMESIKEADEFQPAPVDFTLHDVAELQVMLCKLQQQMDQVMLSVPKEGLAKSGDFIFDVFPRVKLEIQQKSGLLDLLDRIILYLTTVKTNPFTIPGGNLQKFSDLLKTVFSASNCGTDFGSICQTFAKHYKVYLRVLPKYRSKEVAVSEAKNTNWVINGWCFSPGLSMSNLISSGVHSIIVTSGTLSPLTSFASELGIPFPVQLENLHVIQDSQVFVGVISNGPDGTVLNSSFKNRSDTKYLTSLGRTIVNLSRITPDGLLVFFPSYSVLHQCVEYWHTHGIWQSMFAVKPIFMESADKDDFQESIDAYYAKINNAVDSKGASFFAVCRGKVSEGLDFADRNARAVIVTGLPFVPSTDPRVRLKMAYLNSNTKDKGLNGQNWYVLQASRAVNQAIGRIIRHKNDYGAIFLCDERFSEQNIQNQLSKWVRHRIRRYTSFGLALKEATRFFKALEAKKKPEQHCQPLQTPVLEEVMKSSNSTMTRVKDAQQEVTSPWKKIDDTSSILDGYLSQNKTSTESSSHQKSEKRKQSVFDAMESSGSGFQSASTSSFNSRSLEGSGNNEDVSENLVSNSKKRKLNIKLKGLHDDFRSSEHGMDNKESVKEKWIKILREMKKLMGTPQKYLMFTKAVQQFKVDGDTVKFAEQLGQALHDINVPDSMYTELSTLVKKDERTLFVQRTKEFQKLENGS